MKMVKRAFVAGLVLLFGHGVTFLLGIMSGVVHGLRLNYIEFFGWGLTEEGYPFQTFAKKEVSA
jgi:V/A-type H+-transporting ATPase subunit I